MNPLFSILIPAVPSRIARLTALFTLLESQVGDRPVEILSLLDNKKRSIGFKRDALVQSARGKYLAFVDDDDTVADDYVSSIVHQIESTPDVDVIVFDQGVTINGENQFKVTHGLELNNEGVHKKDGLWQDINRRPWHHNVWKTEIAQKHRFTDISYGEDWEWCKRVLKDVTTESRIDKMLHFYRFDEKVTEAK